MVELFDNIHTVVWFTFSIETYTYETYTQDTGMPITNAMELQQSWFKSSLYVYVEKYIGMYIQNQYTYKPKCSNYCGHSGFKLCNDSER